MPTLGSSPLVVDGQAAAGQSGGAGGQVRRHPLIVDVEDESVSRQWDKKLQMSNKKLDLGERC
jgi:hypothetical protein